MPHNDAFKKLSKLWDHLGLPEHGSDIQITAKDKDRCREAVFENVRDDRGMYEPTAKKWAYALYRHCEIMTADVAGRWLDSVLQKHIENGTDQRKVRFPYENKTCLEIIGSLRDFGQHAMNKSSNFGSAESMTNSEDAWLNVLRDAFTEDLFDFVFCFRSTYPKEGGEVEQVMEPVQNGAPFFSDVDFVRSSWALQFETSHEMSLKLSGKYLMYRTDEVIRPEEGQGFDEEPYGWFGTQLVRVIPVSISEEDKCLKWLDYYPDPEVILHETTGIVVEGEDRNFDVYGVDKELIYHPRFFGRFKRLRKNNVTHGVILGNSRYTGGLEAYRYWLKKVDDDVYLSHIREKDKLVSFFHDKKNSAADKKKAHKASPKMFTSVRTLLEDHESELVHYLYLPDGCAPDDLRSEEYVRNMDYSNVRKPLETY